jgi:hypothetical protein
MTARYARRASLVKEDVTAEMTAASERRIIADQAPYAFGALPSVFSTYQSIGFIVATQLNAAISPRIWPLDRFWARPLQDQLKGGHGQPIGFWTMTGRVLSRAVSMSG